MFPDEPERLQVGCGQRSTVAAGSPLGADAGRRPGALTGDRPLSVNNDGADVEQSRRVLELLHVSKSFPGVEAVVDVDLIVRPGETVGIVGENGAGKSTLMKVISGVYPADTFEGELLIEGAPRHFRSVRDAEAAGVVLVPQELYIAPGLSIAENMFMGVLPGRFGFVDEAKLRALAREQLRFFGIAARPDAPAGVLSPSEQRLVTIASALSKSARLIILDEPTAALTEQEAHHLFAHIRRSARPGRGLPLHFASARRDRAHRRPRSGDAQRPRRRSVRYSARQSRRDGARNDRPRSRACTGAAAQRAGRAGAAGSSG